MFNWYLLWFYNILHVSTMKLWNHLWWIWLRCVHHDPADVYGACGSHIFCPWAACNSADVDSNFRTGQMRQMRLGEHGSSNVRRTRFFSSQLSVGWIATCGTKRRDKNHYQEQHPCNSLDDLSLHWLTIDHWLLVQDFRAMMWLRVSLLVQILFRLKPLHDSPQLTTILWECSTTFSVGRSRSQCTKGAQWTFWWWFPSIQVTCMSNKRMKLILKYEDWDPKVWRMKLKMNAPAINGRKHRYVFTVSS